LVLKQAATAVKATSRARARSAAIAVTDRVAAAAVAAETVVAEDVRASDPRTVGRSV
jgi:hypothetical protein